MESKEGKTLAPQDSEQEKHHVQEVIRVAQSELRDLLRRRTEIMHRIGSVKRTLLGLASVFGDSTLNNDWDDPWMDLKSRKRNGERPGFTKTCRIILMEAEGALTAREVCECVKQRLEHVELRHKDPLASVTTVLNRLADYGEARMLVAENGRRAWQWIAETSSNEQTREAQKATERTESSPQKSSVTD
ncbi:MAG: hypothetical protein ABSE92_08775 [Terriglobales bacterium]|jgi:hypothetical protein